MKNKYIIYLFFGCLVAGVPLEDSQEWLQQKYEQQLEIQILGVRPTTGLIEKYYYPARVHRVATDDDYILEMHRMPFGDKSPEVSGKPVVFLQHGLFGSSADWVMMGPTKDLAFILADLGFDVWMGNSRGNVYSRAHESLAVNSSEFWDFSFHEMGKYDLPASIDYVLEKSGQEKLFYVGYAQGATQFYVMASERPEYNDKIKAMFSLAPMAFMDHTESPLLRVVAHYEDDDEKLTDLLGTGRFLPSQELIQMIGQATCNETAVTPLMCNNILFLNAGFDSLLLNKTLIPVVLGHTPIGVAKKQLVHYAQEVNSGLFRQYDYHLGNLLQYGRLSPPEYDLRKITCPVALYYGSSDVVSHPKDVDRLYNLLVNPIGKFLVPLESFGHLDFLWAVDAKTLIYNNITDLMRSYIAK